jgi:hypothetical protein
MGGHTIDHVDEFTADGPGRWIFNLALQGSGLLYFIDDEKRADGVQLPMNTMWQVPMHTHTHTYTRTHTHMSCTQRTHTHTHTHTRTHPHCLTTTENGGLCRVHWCCPPRHEARCAED